MTVEQESISLAELSEKADLPARTIRFYIAKGLLPGPRKAGRAACYGEEHLERIREIRTAQAEGLTLAEIQPKLSGDANREEFVQPTTWHSYQLDADIVVNVRAGTSPWRQKQIQRAIRELAKNLTTTTNKE